MPLIELENCSFVHNHLLIFAGFTWKLNPGEQWLVTGDSGSGKTSFFEALNGKYRLAEGHFKFKGQSGQEAINLWRFKTAAVYFKNTVMNTATNYYQQRYNSQDADDTLTVRRFIFGDSMVDEGAYHSILEAFHTSIPLDKELIKLSNGENRKILIARALLSKPEILILDNPYTGLDKSSRNDLNTLIDQLIKSGLIVLLSSKQTLVPSCFTQVLMLENRKIKYAGPVADFPVSTPPISMVSFPVSFENPVQNDFDIAVQLNQVTVRYEEKILLDRLNLTIRRGEKWAIQGPNGAGKTLVASLIYADHPQSYVNDIVLFDQRRGKGESIWMIKEKTGFLSPEFHFYFDENQTAFEVALSGLKDNPYRPGTITGATKDLARSLFEFYKIEHLSDLPMYALSSGFQRLVLFIRVIVKNPPFLLLDEPFHNFDQETIQRSKHLLDEFCKERTMVFITHDEKEIPSCVTRRFIMNKIEPG
ncbi:MAG: ATP-binding cassette domain-containing protein [Saprospiraceae bacterium]|nr:ATP-binding cassette domain-containing protein [Saprospiraceae bacterium]